MSFRADLRACQWIIHVAVQNLMELQDMALRDGDSVKAFMYDGLHVTVPGDFLLISVLWCGFFLYKLLDTGAGGNDAFHGIGRFCTLYLCDFHQLFKFFRTVFQVQLLFARFFIYGGNQAENI